MATMTYPEPLSPEKETEVILKAYEGDPFAQKMLIEHNLRLVIYIANKFKNSKTDLEDLTSIGSIGLIKAVNTFNPHKNIKFATYASRCIQNEILMHLRKTKKVQYEVFLEDSIRQDDDGNELSILDIVGTKKDEIEEEITNNDTVIIVKEILEGFTEDERKIIEYRFGLYGERKKQTEIADFLNISQSYVSRIEKKVLKRIKKKFEKLA